MLEKEERLKSIIDRDIYQIAGEAYEELSKSHGECYTDCWSNLFFTDEELIENHCLEDLSAEKQEEALEELKDSGQDWQEIFEFWLVSEWLYEQLKRENAPVLEWKGLHFWGRCETGQSLTLDYHLNKVNNRIHKTVAA